MDTKAYLIYAGFTEEEADNIHLEVEELSINFSNKFAMGFEMARENIVKAMAIIK